MEQEYNIRKGIVYLRRYADKHGFCLHRLSDVEFAGWVAAQLAAHSNDPLLAQRCKVRDLKKMHRHDLERLQKKLALAQADYATCKSKERLDSLPYLIANARKAIAGLEQAMHERQGEKRLACAAKLEEFRQNVQALQNEYDALWHSTPEKQALEKAEQELRAFQESIGLIREESLVAELARQQGQHAEAHGDLFEKNVYMVLQQEIVPALARRSIHQGEDWEKIAPRIHLLAKVTLGCARAELDYVVVWRPHEEPDAPVEVLAVVEVKRNPNDIADGFCQRQENLAWFCGDAAGYDPAIYRTRIFKLGHFDRPAKHEQNGMAFVFTRESFRRFQRDRETGYFVDHLFFITRQRTLLGMSGGDYAKFLYHVATDSEFALESPVYLAKLQQWLVEQIPCFQTVDVFRLYAKHRAWGDQFLVLEKQH